MEREIATAEEMKDLYVKYKHSIDSIEYLINGPRFIYNNSTISD